MKNKDKEIMLSEIIKQRDELYDLLKAIINKFGEQEIVVSRQEINNAKRGQIYVSKELLRDANKYQLVFEENFLNSYKQDR